MDNFFKAKIKRKFDELSVNDLSINIALEIYYPKNKTQNGGKI
jgi:hypothetical protein